jgi:hypothetical protein
MLRYGRQASSRISERFLMTTLATLGSEFGGSNIGTALGGFNQAVVGNRFTHTAALGFAQLGLIDDKDLARTKTGEIKGILPGRHVKDVGLAQSDPDLWIKQDYLPVLAKAGIATPDAIAAYRPGFHKSQRRQSGHANRIAASEAGKEHRASGLKAPICWGRRMLQRRSPAWAMRSSAGLRSDSTSIATGKSAPR